MIAYAIKNEGKFCHPGAISFSRKGQPFLYDTLPEAIAIKQHYNNLRFASSFEFEIVECRFDMKTL